MYRVSTPQYLISPGDSSEIDGISAAPAQPPFALGPGFFVDTENPQQ